MKLSHAPTRLATGAFILNAGVGKLSADDDTAKALYGMATGTYPFLSAVEPRTFTKLLGSGEIAVGAMLLSPFVPAWVAGGALTGFSGALLGMYHKTPGMTKEDGIRPTQMGTPIAKDVWMLGVGLSLLMDDLSPRHRRRGRGRKARAARARVVAAKARAAR
jgi:zinc transporter ZupT